MTGAAAVGTTGSGSSVGITSRAGCQACKEGQEVAVGSGVGVGHGVEVLVGVGHTVGVASGEEEVVGNKAGGETGVTRDS